jgi:sec-independent protein translocase protein TatA
MLTGILQPTHLIILLVVALLFLGPKRLPEAGRAVGQGLREFKNSISGDVGDADSGDHLEPPPSDARASQSADHDEDQLART